MHQYKFSKYISSKRYLDKIAFSEQVNLFSNQSLRNLLSLNNYKILYFKSYINSNLIIAQKSKSKIKYVKKGNVTFEILYLKYLVIIISKLFLFLFELKILLKKFLKI